jgi:hypothetical protein
MWIQCNGAMLLASNRYHEVNTFQLMLERLRTKFDWEPIKDCPGRYIVRKSIDNVTPEAILQLVNVDNDRVKTRLYQRENQDDVFVAVFCDQTGGGIITFCKPTGSFVHTMNEPDGLVRKLRGLGFPELLEIS